MTRLTRRAMPIAPIAAVLAAWAVLPAAAGAETITFASFGGTYQAVQRETLLDPAEAALGITIAEAATEGLAGLRTRLAEGPAPWDIVSLGVADCVAASAEGLLEPLDSDVVPVDGFAPAAFAEHWVGSIYYSHVLAYDTGAFGDAPPGDWADFWDVERFPGPRALRDDPQETLEVALMADGVAPDQLYPLDLDRAFASLAAIGDHVDLWWSDGAEPAEAFAAGEIVLGAIWNGRIDALQAEGVPVAFTFTQGVASLDCFAIPRGSPRRDTAMAALAVMLDPAQQAGMMQRIHYGSPTALAFERGGLDAERRAALPSEPANLARQAVFDAEYWLAHREEIEARWAAFRGR